jgi:hypothetical protein
MYDMGLLGSLVDLVSVECSLQPFLCFLGIGFILSLQFAIDLPPRGRILWSCILKLRLGLQYVSSDESLPEFCVVFGNVRRCFFDLTLCYVRENG